LAKYSSRETFPVTQKSQRSNTIFFELIEKLKILLQITDIILLLDPSSSMSPLPKGILSKAMKQSCMHDEYLKSHDY